MSNDGHDDNHDMDEFARTVADADVFLRAVAIVAKGDAPDGLRDELTSALPEIEAHGLQIAGAIERIWAGERDATSLTADCNGESRVVIQRILELIDMPSPAEVIATMPPSLQHAIESGDQDAFMAALEALSEEEQAALMDKLVDAGLFGPMDDDNDIDEITSSFEPILIAISEVAKGGVPASLRAEIEQELLFLEKNDVYIREPVQRIWAGERDLDALVNGLDSVDRELVARILVLIST